MEIGKNDWTSYRMEPKHKRGRPRRRWKDRVKKGLKELGIENGVKRKEIGGDKRLLRQRA